MSVGFTGTRKGMTDVQKTLLNVILRVSYKQYGPVFSEGEADGADLEARAIAEEVGYVIDPHPAGNDPLGRNRIIVDGSDLMIAAPSNYINIPRGSGTWYTIRYARKQGKLLFIIRPDGTMDA